MGQSSYTEKDFEDEVIELLKEQGYQQYLANEFDKETALIPSQLYSFLKDTQEVAYQKLEKVHGDNTESRIAYRLQHEIKSRGLLDVIRNGITTHGVKLKLAYFKPVSKLNEEAYKKYEQNILSVTRQVKYDRKNENSIDLLISLNGFSIATIELKNAFTGQTTANAEKQYIFDRNFKEPLFHFNKGSLVHFAVDADTCSMTTKVAGKKTFYLPFNKGYDNGAGNPPNEDGRRTDYLWNEVFAKSSVLELIGKFIHLEKDEDGNWDKLIFPRYHQMDAVRKLVADAKVSGTGKNYLIQHSAGSGKSNSIAWLSYRLSSLHNDQDQRIFDSVIVITDRTVLDNQLQDTIYQFEHTQGVVQRIDKDSSQLAKALQEGKNIIITTLQKFPFVIGKISGLPARNYAVIVDESHSSQGGEATKKMKEVLSSGSLEEAADEDDVEIEDGEDQIRKSMMARGKQDNLSFFGFTATPKYKTLEVFGTKEKEGKPKPFHLYSMKQAIQEGFIHDVLKNYTTYKTFFKLTKAIQDDPEVNKKKAAIAIARFVKLHPHNIAQKTEVMVEHFRRVVAHKIGGKAKAMLVTSSRLHAVRYKLEFDRYIKEKKYTDIKTLVAFSGTVNDGGAEYTEPQMTGFSMSELKDKFHSNEYQVLIVANKYQTGFDEPLLHTMYVDKPLSGVLAVQTLSRLNRTTKGKEGTFVLDFVNEEESIKESFQPFYELTTVEESTDPDHLYDLKNQLESSQILWQSEIDNFASTYFKAGAELSKKDHAKLNSYIDPAVQRFIHMPSEDEQENFKHAATTFTRLYSFLTQIMPFQDAELEKLFAYLRFLLKKLPRKETDKFQLGDEVALEYYRIQKMRESAILLEDQAEYGLDGIKEAGIRQTKEDKAQLSEIINVLNDRFGTEFKDGDKLFFDQIEEELSANSSLQQQAKSNTKENFKYGFEEMFLNSIINRMDQNQDIFQKIMDDQDFSKVVKGWMLEKVYERLRKD
ncbi:type I restriction endonuclease subunit R [Marivirga harenae]|uniref:type I restriction endonuclease subunit R n=1 Tax=Marivirga harenae TaxID=2010992 RepID=UPI0026DFC62F|nr:DEAD/DEAH box helicase family protein [Marivirga harenae]WKV12190.1 DEAD/DEAH box helicase family protein [Marivirga harenae]